MVDKGKFLASLDPETRALVEAFAAELRGDPPGLVAAKLMFLEGRKANGEGVARAIVSTRRRFATPGERVSRRRVLAAREGLVAAGVFGVGAGRGTWRRDKPCMALLAPGLDGERAIRLIDDAIDGFVEVDIYDEPAGHVRWWYVDEGWRR